VLLPFTAMVIEIYQTLYFPLIQQTLAEFMQPLNLIDMFQSMHIYVKFYFFKHSTKRSFNKSLLNLKAFDPLRKVINSLASMKWSFP
jgi:hypothetical protein